MPTLEERVAFLEGKVNEQSQLFSSVRDAIAYVEHRGEIRFEAIDRRFDAIDRRFEAMDRRFDTVDRRIDALDDKVSRHFIWIVGIQITTLIAVVGAVLSRG